MPSFASGYVVGSIGNRYGYSNPCPDGLYLNTMVAETTFGNDTFKNITYLICDTNNPHTPDLGLILGLSLGLGIPALIVVITIIYCCYCTKTRRNLHNNTLLENMVMPANEPGIFDILTPESQRLFGLGILNDTLKNELMSLTKDQLFSCRKDAIKNNKHNISDYIAILLDQFTV